MAGEMVVVMMAVVVMMMAVVVVVVEVRPETLPSAAAVVVVVLIPLCLHSAAASELIGYCIVHVRLPVVYEFLRSELQRLSSEQNCKEQSKNRLASPL